MKDRFDHFSEETILMEVWMGWNGMGRIGDEEGKVSMSDSHF